MYNFDLSVLSIYFYYAHQSRADDSSTIRNFSFVRNYLLSDVTQTKVTSCEFNLHELKRD